jgi:calcineurin-like phosphoesterase family protein
MISDTHFGHYKIIEYENRPFKDVQEMELKIIKNWNKTVTREDLVFFLGDFSFYNKEKTQNILKSLNGRKTLILGNHDFRKSLNWWREVGFENASKYPIVYDEFYILSHKPIYLTENMPYANIHGHIHHLKYESKQYFNVSVECIDYTPIDFDEIKKAMINCEIQVD